MKLGASTWLAGLLIRPVLGALVGYGIYPYSSYCAYACHRSLSALMLECSVHMDSGGAMSHADMVSPDCRASDTLWLTTLAWCMRSKCADFQLPTSELEAFWEGQSTGDPALAPKWTYSTALVQIVQAPTQTLTLIEADTILNFTGLVNPATYEAQYNALTTVQRENTVESRYGIALLVTGFVTPIILTWLGYVPYLSTVLGWIRPYLVYPSIIGRYQVQPLPYLLGNAPTVGQALYVIIFFILNLILTAVNYEAKQPHAWYATQGKEVTAFIFYRTGVFAFVLMPLILLFSSRNNILLWMTDWSHSTFLVLHRWVARIFALQVLLHTLLALPLYYPREAKQQYWIWGAVATVAVMILVVASGLYVRAVAYEFFLIMHILLSVFVLVGCWYHIKLWIGLTWGYETWLYAACAVWFFDRLARVGRIIANGVHKAHVTDLGGGYIRVDVMGVRWGSEPGKHVYVFFPTINRLRPWENHPFSVMQTASLEPLSGSTLTPSADSVDGSPITELNHDIDTEKIAGSDFLSNSHRRKTALHPHAISGLTLLIKKSTGLTKSLQSHSNLPVLLDGPYHNISSKKILSCDRLLLIGGGIGITSLLPWAAHHWNVKLVWSVKASAACLVDSLVDNDSALMRGIKEKDVRIGGMRMDLREVLEMEREKGWERVGVVVSGPGGLCDDVRAGVVAMGQKRGMRTVFELEVEAYSW